MQFVLYYVVWFICLYNISCMFDKNIAHRKVAQPRRPSKNRVTVVNAHSHLEKSRARQSKSRNHFVTDAAPYGCTLPRRIIALMFWSDATHLTSFGDAKLWPLYVFFGNQTKYSRGQPSAKLCNHVAYFQTVSISYCCKTYISANEFGALVTRRLQGFCLGTQWKTTRWLIFHTLSPRTLPCSMDRAS